TRGPQHMAARPHILVVDHSPELLEFFQELLTEEGYCVTPWAQLEGGIDMVAKINPDLLMIEYRWEAMDETWSSLRQLRTHQLTRHVPIILCTSLVREVGLFQQTLCELNVRVVLKPFEIEQLLGEIAAALAA
ncbi:MAG: response regulator, partial [Thermomicrobiales bacterium]